MTCNRSSLSFSNEILLLVVVWYTKKVLFVKRPDRRAVYLESPNERSNDRSNGRRVFSARTDLTENIFQAFFLLARTFAKTFSKRVFAIHLVGFKFAIHSIK